MAAKLVARPEPPKLPEGLSPREEAAWWDEHQDYWDAASSRGADEVIGPAPVRRTKPITIRLPVGMLDALRHEAGRRGIPYQTLIRMWLKQQLDAVDTAR